VSGRARGGRREKEGERDDRGGKEGGMGGGREGRRWRSNFIERASEREAVFARERHYMREPSWRRVHR